MLECGIPPKYVMDEMEMFEIRSIIKHKHLKYKESWEMTRFVAWITAQVNSTKQIELQKVLKFPWEKETEEKNTITKEEIEALKEKAKQYQKFLK